MSARAPAARLVVIVLLPALLSCSGLSSSSDGGPPVHLSGAIQKGPFVVGSSVQVSMIEEATGQPTGVVFNATTRDDLGQFELTLPHGGAADLTTSGYYFNEVAGRLSKAPITLHARVKLGSSDAQSVYVNSLTQLSYLRAQKLLADGRTFGEAVQQAELDVKSSFGLLAGQGAVSGTAMNLLGGDTDANAYLFAMSCVLARAAQLAAPDSDDAKLQELLNAVALDVESDGVIGPSLQATIRQGIRGVDPIACTKNMAARLAETGSQATPPDIFRALDFDFDGISDALDDDADGDGLKAGVDQPALAGSSGTTNFAVEANGQVWSWAEGGGPALLVATLAPIRGLAPHPSRTAFVLADGTACVMPDQGSSCTPVVGLTDAISAVPQLCSSIGDMLFTKSDGTVWNVPERKTTAAQVSGLSAVAAIAGDPVHGGGTTLVKTDGTLWTAKTGPTPNLVKVEGVGQMTAVAGSGWYCNGFVGLDASGTAWTWTFDQQGAAIATELATDVATLAADGSHLIKRDGTAWKRTGSTLSEVAGLTGVKAMSYRGNVALMSDGSVKQLVVDSYEAVRIPR